MNRIPALLWRLVALPAAALLPSALPGGLPARPDLVLLVVTAAALMHGAGTGALLGLAGGWLVDLVPPGGDPLGASALSYLAAGALAGWSRRFATFSWLLPVLATVAAAALVQGVRGLTAAAGVGTAHPVDLLWSVLITTVAAVVLLPALLAVERALVGRGWV